MEAALISGPYGTMPGAYPVVPGEAAIAFTQDFRNRQNGIDMRTWRRLSELAALATVAGGLAFTGISAAVADAGHRVAGTRINNLATGRCLYDSGDAGGGTFTGSCLTGNRYWLGYADDFGNRIVNTSTGRCLTASTS